MAQYSDRNKRLRELAITESQLSQWKREGYEEATWRNAHELKVQLKWAKERHDFIQQELDRELKPAKAKSPARKNTPPIVSHKHGHGHTTNQQIYGESWG